MNVVSNEEAAFCRVDIECREVILVRVFLINLAVLDPILSSVVGRYVPYEVIDWDTSCISRRCVRECSRAVFGERDGYLLVVVSRKRADRYSRRADREAVILLERSAVASNLSLQRGVVGARAVGVVSQHYILFRPDHFSEHERGVRELLDEPEVHCCLICSIGRYVRCDVILRGCACVGGNSRAFVKPIGSADLENVRANHHQGA